jgi:hypothetical protein
MITDCMTSGRTKNRKTTAPLISLFQARSRPYHIDRLHGNSRLLPEDSLQEVSNPRCWVRAYLLFLLTDHIIKPVKGPVCDIVV